MNPFNRQIQAMFNHIAPTYDLLNHLLSAGEDIFWRRVAIRPLPAVQPGEPILDLCSGSGDLAFALARRFPANPILGLDFSHRMLEEFQRKILQLPPSSPTQIALIQGNGEELPLRNGSMAIVTCAFGVRNFSDRTRGLTEIFRVLREGGTLSILELSLPGTGVLRTTFMPYLQRILPFLGQLISGDDQAYAYLPQSIQRFPTPRAFRTQLRRTGFRAVRSFRLTAGICRLFTAKKPPTVAKI